MPSTEPDIRIERPQPIPRLALDVPSGAEVGRGLAGLGEALFDIGQRITQAENAMALSTLQRQSGEIWNAAYNTIITTPDSDARLKIFEKAQDDASKLESKWPQANKAYQMHLNETFPHLQAQFNAIDRHLRIQAAKDQLELNGQVALEKGDLFQYYKDLNTGLSTGLLSQVEFDYKTKNAPTASVFAQSRILIGNNNPQMAITMLEGLKDLSGEQMDYRDKLLRMATQNIQINADAAENEVIYGMHANRDKTITERAIIGEGYIATLRLANVSPTRFDKLVGDIEKWMTGEARPNNSMVYVELVKDVERLKSGVGEPSEVRRKIRDSFTSLDDEHFESITKMLEADIPSFQADETARILRYAEKQLVTMDEPTWIQFLSIAKGKELQEATSKRQLEFWNLSEYDKELRDWIAKNPDATRDEIYVQSRKLLVHYRRRTIPQIETLMKVKEAAILTMEENVKRAEAVSQKEKRIKVRSPNGQLFTVPENQMEEAVSQGYIVVGTGYTGIY